MKTYIFLILTSAAFSCYSQNAWSRITESELRANDDSLCAARGHVPAGTQMVTSAYCPDIVETNDSTTVIIHPACNKTTFQCAVCGKTVTVDGVETRYTIWRKK